MDDIDTTQLNVSEEISQGLLGEWLLYNPHAEMIDNFPYLIFDSKNTQGVENGQKRFLFKGNELIFKP